MGNGNTRMETSNGHFFFCLFVCLFALFALFLFLDLVLRFSNYDGFFIKKDGMKDLKDLLIINQKRNEFSFNQQPNQQLTLFFYYICYMIINN